MRFLVIPEDSRNDQYLIEPILQALLTTLGYANPKLRVCRDPLMGGVSEALKPERIEEVIAQYEGMVDVVILCVDRDADPHRRARLDAIEQRFAPQANLVAVEAWQELETWALAGLELPGEWRWRDVRSSRDVKEEYFADFAQRRRLTLEPGGGRRTLGREAARRIDRIRTLCPEDFDALALRLAALRNR